MYNTEIYFHSILKFRDNLHGDSEGNMSHTESFSDHHNKNVSGRTGLSLQGKCLKMATVSF